MGKHLHYFTEHSLLVLPTDKPAVSYCAKENEVHYRYPPYVGATTRWSLLPIRPVKRPISK